MQLWTDPGEFRHIVRVEQKGTTKGTSGEVIETWSKVKDIRCKIWQVKGEEAERAKRETGRSTFKKRCPFTPSITQAMRLVFKGRHFDITNVNNIEEMNRELEITSLETI